MKFRLALVGIAIWIAGLATPAYAASVYGEFAGDARSVTLVGSSFPAASISTSGNSLSVARSATLTGSTPFGAQYGTSSGKTYLSVNLNLGSPEPATTTLTFASLTPTAGWSFALGDVDAESVSITATGEGGATLDVSSWYSGSFNYQSGGTDQPTWATNVLSGRGSDTNGASAWFTPNAAVSSITFAQRRLVSGSPSYQLWIAADSAAFPTTTSTSTSTSSSTSSSTTSTTTSLPMQIDEAPVITGDDVQRDGSSYVVELTMDNTGLLGTIEVIEATTNKPGDLSFDDNFVIFTPGDQAEGRVTIEYVAKNDTNRFMSGRIRFTLETTPSLSDESLPSTGSRIAPNFALNGMVIAAIGGAMILRRRRV